MFNVYLLQRSQDYHIPEILLALDFHDKTGPFEKTDSLLRQLPVQTIFLVENVLEICSMMSIQSEIGTCLLMPLSITCAAQPTNTFFPTVNQMFSGSSQLPIIAELAVIKSLSTVQKTTQCSAVVGSWSHRTFD